MIAGNGIITLNADKTDITNTSFDWDLTLPGKNGLDAHWGVEMTYDYYKINFNRNSIDNNGYALYSYINKGGFLYSDNASWDGNAMNFGTRSNSGGAGVTGIDVTGHELTHGVTQFTCNLNYSKEPGAINESISDIMGKSVQFFAKPADKDWRLSNDMNWFIRDMSNPNAYAQPDTYGGSKWLSGGFNYLLDNGGVHTNSGVGNFMFYLLVDGGSGTNDIGNAFNVQGIGLSKADQIVYRSQTVYLVPTSQYTDWRTACINAARDLYGKGSNELKQVKNAFYAVGIGTGAVATAVATNQTVSVTPNPVHGINAVARFDLQSGGDVVMKLYDGSAHVLHVYNIGSREKGAQSFTLQGTAGTKGGQLLCHG
jgi:Zn-dependent metalloprotease